jgi:hypothetical protein
MTANILFLSSNPKDQPSLDVIDECKLVDTKLKEAQHNEYVELIAEHPISIADLQGILLRYQPDIVHFSGHGTQRGELVFENSDGVTEIVPPVALAELFDIITRTTRISVVILNACYSVPQAEAIAQETERLVL